MGTDTNPLSKASLILWSCLSQHRLRPQSQAPASADQPNTPSPVHPVARFFATVATAFNSGKDKVKCHKDSNTKSGNELSRYFCGDCGSPLYLTNSQFEGLVILYTGCVDTDAKHERPRGVLFDDNRRKWFAGVEGASKL